MTDSDRLRAFVAEAPLERGLILAFVRDAAAAAPAGARVLDAGAGDAPYRELFAHADYPTSDWSESVHEGARRADIVASLDALPVADASFDLVVCTQVLEHVPEPAAVLEELRRVLRPGGELWLTVPSSASCTRSPTTSSATRATASAGLRTSGLRRGAPWPLGGYFTAMAQLARNCGPAIGVGTGRGELGRRILAAAFRGAARALPRLDRLDPRRALPIGFACRAVAQPASTRA